MGRGKKRSAEDNDDGEPCAKVPRVAESGAPEAPKLFSLSSSFPFKKDGSSGQTKPAFKFSSGFSFPDKKTVDTTEQDTPALPAFSFGSGFGFAKKAPTVGSAFLNTGAMFASSKKETVTQHVRTETTTISNVQASTGEEDEQRIDGFACKLYAMVAKEGRWAERGRGELRINLPKEGDGRAGSGRLVMRIETTGRVILNVNLYAGMELEAVNDTNVRFAALEDEQSMTFLARFTKKSDATEFCVVMRRLISGSNNNEQAAADNTHSPERKAV